MNLSYSNSNKEARIEILKEQSCDTAIAEEYEPAVNKYESNNTRNRRTCNESFIMNRRHGLTAGLHTFSMNGLLPCVLAAAFSF